MSTVHSECGFRMKKAVRIYFYCGLFIAYCSVNNKNSETHIGFRCKNQKNKAGKPLEDYLYQGWTTAD